MRKTESAILEAVHETAKGLHKAGVMDHVTLHEFERRCFLSVASPTTEQMMQFCTHSVQD